MSSTSRRSWNLSRWTLLLIFAALLVGGMSAYAARTYIMDEIAAHQLRLDSRYSPVNVIVARQTMPPGTALDDEMVAMREVPRSFLHRDAIAASDWERLKHRTTQHAVTAGAPVLRSQLTGPSGGRFADRIDQGKRALTFPVDNISSISGMLAPGDHIDVLMTLRRDRTPVTVPLMKNTKIVATGTETAADTLERQRFNTVTIMANPEQAAKIIYAQEVGTLRVVLRARGDLSDGWPERMTLARLLNEPEPHRPTKKPARLVDIIVGGRAGAGR